MSEWIKLTTKEAAGVGEDAEQGEPSCTVGVTASQSSHAGGQFGGSSKVKDRTTL